MTDLFTSQSFEDPKNKDKLELTSLVTCYLLRDGIDSNKKYQDEVKTLEALMPEDKQLKKDFALFRTFNPTAAERLLNRYTTIKKELGNLNPNIIFVGACGLSPLGVVYANQHKKAFVFDSDLAEVVSYRKRKNLILPSNYRIDEVDLLDKNLLNQYIQNIKPQLPQDMSVALVVEGLTFYLNEDRQRQFHNNMKDVAEKLKLIRNVKSLGLIFDYYVSEQKAKEGDMVKTNYPGKERFDTLFGPIANNQKMRFKTRNEVSQFLFSNDYKTVRVSSGSPFDSPHTIFVCEYK